MLKSKKATSAGQRHQIVVDRKDLYSGEAEKSLLFRGYKKRQGKGFKGHITMRHRGGGVHKRMRIIDWRRQYKDIEAVVKRVEYDPMRGANIALLFYKNGHKAYILASKNIKVGDKVVAGEKIEAKEGNAMPLKNIPIGLSVHNIELRPGKGAQIVRGAGTYAVVQAKEGSYVTLQLPSGEHRLIHENCLATIGEIGNQDWKNRKIGKAGRKRLMGIRPTVRGTAQDPNSHPHGGGEGRSGVGLVYPKTPWGKIAAPGYKTRKKRKSNKWIIKDRRKK